MPCLGLSLDQLVDVSVSPQSMDSLVSPWINWQASQSRLSPWTLWSHLGSTGRRLGLASVHGFLGLALEQLVDVTVSPQSMDAAVSPWINW